MNLCVTTATATDAQQNRPDQGLLTDLILNYPKDKADYTAMRFLDNSGQEKSHFSYQQLASHCASHAGALQRHADPGQVVLLALDNAADFVSVFFGCLLAGIIAVPVPTPRGSKDSRGLCRLVNIARTTDAQLVISDGQTVTTLAQQSQLKGQLKGGLNAQLLSMEQLNSDCQGSPLLPVKINPQDTAYLQFTSGSTARPKGVRLTHANVMASLEAMAAIYDYPEELRLCGWLPLHHDMGLVGLVLAVLHQRGCCVLLPPAAFLSAPQRWFEAIERYQSNICAAPNFTFAHCVKKIKHTKHDISSMKTIFVGSEYVSIPTLKAFCEKFADNGFRASSFVPVYGLAEATLLGAGGGERLPQMLATTRQYAPNEKASKRQLIGYPINPQFPIHIVQDHKVVIGGDAVAHCYWPDNREACRVIDGQSFFDTGDVGFIADNRLYLTGRAKDTLIIRGVNHHAEDLEYSIQSCIGTQHGHSACIATGHDAGERLIVIQETSRHIKPPAAKALKASILAVLAQEHGVNADEVILIAANTLPRTLNHKVSRNDCLDQYQNNAFRLVGIDKQPQPTPNNEGSNEGNPLDEPIAIVAMACRFPGGCDDLDSFWQLLSEGKDAIIEVPHNRWNNDKFFDPTPATPGKTNTRWAGFVDDIDQFDPAFFGISPTEAVEMDPQQRMLLETAWRLFEGAGQTRADLQGSDTGVFVGISTNDYLYMKIKLTPGMKSFNAYSGLGNANSIAANRLSYLFDLKGPSMAVDTACSSSMTALHLAAQAVKSGECSQAIAGGVNAIISPGPTISLSQFGMMAPDGRCKTFDSRADGYVRAEGCALVMLKRKSDALQNGDEILGYIRASALAQDGHSNGITHPNADAQAQLLRRTLAKGKVDPRHISYIEAHGTGTSAGDPIEINELRDIYGNGEHPCHIGSVKASIGHLEAGAGIAGVMKVLLMLRHGQIPPQLHLQNINPAIKLAGSRFNIATELTDWQSEGPRMAAVSSFGFGGALGHIILEQGPESQSTRIQKNTINNTTNSHLFTLSAANQSALYKQARVWCEYLENSKSTPLASICYSQANHRSDFTTRYAVQVKNVDGLIKELNQFIRFKPPAVPANPIQPTFVFTGQGQNYHKMGHLLYQRFAVFRQAFDRCRQAYNQLTHGPALEQLIFECLEDAPVDSSTYQCHLFAVQYGQCQLWASLGITPQLMIGHSVGEFAVAVNAGCMTVEDAVELLYRRGQLIETVAPGAMASLSTDRASVEKLLPDVAIAAQNSPKATVISGTLAQIEQATAIAEDQGIGVKRLRAQSAFHSPMMADIVDTFVAYAAQVQYNEPTIAWISTVTGKAQTEAPTAQYWGQNLRQTVLFEPATQVMGEQSTFIEIGPGGTSLAMISDILNLNSTLLLRSSTRPKADRTETASLLDSIGKLYTHGHRLFWRDFYPEQESVKVDIPAQAFNRKRFWIKDANWDKLDAFASDSHSADSVNDDGHDGEAPLYRVEWIENTLGQSEALDTANWIIVGEPSQLGGSLTEQLSGKIYTVVPQANRAQYHAKLSHVINIQANVGDKNWRVLYCNALACQTQFSTQSLDKDQDCHGPADLTRLVQAILDTGEVMPLWVLTQGAQSVGEDNPANLQLAQTPIWGFARTLYLEQPQLRGGIIDFDEVDETLVRQLCSPQQERAVALRKGTRYIAQLKGFKAAQTKQAGSTEPAEPFKLRNDGWHIITGGLGGLGLKTCRWLVDNGVKKVILLSRSGLPSRDSWPALDRDDKDFARVQSVMAIEKTKDGVDISIEQLDIRDSEALTGLVENLDAPLRGITHAAGVNWFSKIAQLDEQRMLDSLKTNISAAWKLHQLSENADLDCFILYSSVSALWGSVELSHYTAANHFLDALANYRAARNLPALSIDWGPWDEVGMSAKESEKQVLKKLGFQLMTPQNALDGMASLLALKIPQAMIGGIDWHRFKPFIDFSLAPSLFAAVEAQNHPDNEDNSEPGCLADIANMPQSEGLALLDSVVRSQLAAVMLIDSIDTLDENHRFNFLGMDSLMAISFAAQLEQFLGIKMPTTLAYNYPTIKDVRRFIYQQITGKVADESVDVAMAMAVAEPVEVPKWLKAIDDNEEGLQIYCFPYAGSGASVYEGFKGKVKGAKFTAIQYPGREDHSDIEAIKDINAMVTQLKQKLNTDQPFALVGHSLGALIAYEVACSLNKPPEFVVLSGSDSPHAHKPGELHQQTDDEFVQSVIKRYNHQPLKAGQKEAIESILPTLRADIQMLETYQPQLHTLTCPLHIVGGKADPVTHQSGLRQWISLTDERFSLSLHDGGHDIIKENPAPLLAAIENELKQTTTLGSKAQ
jgi:acyl transferase domain-containing protein/acyl-CoA synthetase (AMP-forming)/AMP-acid ligase II/surfactin synthase thioesterase subunit/acyl carrier protein